MTRVGSAIRRHFKDSMFRLAGKANRSIHSYHTYEEYVAHQKEKTTDPKRIRQWQGPEWNTKLQGFRQIFARNASFIDGAENAICLGSRTGQEVVALRELGINAIGVDLVPFEPYTIEGDIHDLQFRDDQFDLVFSNIFDHALLPEKFVSEIERILSPSKHAILQIQIGSQIDEYSETAVYSPKRVEKLFNKSRIVESRFIENSFDRMDWEIIVQRNGSPDS